MAGDFYGIDFGGTNLRIGKVDPLSGALEQKIFTHQLDDVCSNEQLSRIIFDVIPSGSKVGISAAGDVDEAELILTFSPNSPLRHSITFGQDLKNHHGCRVVMTNDMRAAIQAVARYGEGKNQENVLLASYGTGFNAAMAREKKNITTAEFSHQLYQPQGDLFCGCGAKGHLEIYVSGSGAASMARQYFSITHNSSHQILSLSLEEYNHQRKEQGKEEFSDLTDFAVWAAVVQGVNASGVYQAYKNNPEQEPQKTIQKVQQQAIADSFGRMVSAYNPVDIIVIMGGQSKNWDALFKPSIAAYQQGNFQLATLKKPPIVPTTLLEIGVQGAVAYYVSKNC